jgi:hypothetical protein
MPLSIIAAHHDPQSDIASQLPQVADVSDAAGPDRVTRMNSQASGGDGGTDPVDGTSNRIRPPVDGDTNYVVGKLNSYTRARQYLTGYENAPLGLDFTQPGATPEFKAAGRFWQVGGWLPAQIVG